ncbi:MAG: cbb3-type cytochrome c oxidase subunit 3 [Cyclobacteriaceae bacterium]|jgi:hypothetical protein
MYKEILQEIDNVAIWPIISFIIFFFFFLGLIWWVLRADCSYVREMSELPLDENCHKDHQTSSL